MHRVFQVLSSCSRYAEPASSHQTDSTMLHVTSQPATAWLSQDAALGQGPWLRQALPTLSAAESALNAGCGPPCEANGPSWPQVAASQHGNIWEHEQSPKDARDTGSAVRCDGYVTVWPPDCQLSQLTRQHVDQGRCCQGCTLTVAAWVRGGVRFTLCSCHLALLKNMV
jgi:hypothetical protein